jgi:hypothetical protein
MGAECTLVAVNVHSGAMIDLSAVRDLLVEAEGLEAAYGPNPYVAYLRAHHRRPPPAEADTMGRLLGGRVRADDGKLYPGPKRRAR